MRLATSLACAITLLASFVQAGMYGQPVINLDARTFKQVMATEHAAMVAFVAPWCGHCKNLGPEFTAAAASLSPLIPFYAVDCDDSANKPLCGEYQIQGFPTIKAFPRAGKGPAKDYNGERKKGPLVEYAKTLVPDRVKKLRVDKEGKEDGVIKGFLNEKLELPHVLLVHPSAPSIPFLWKVLAHRLSGKMHLGYVRDTTSHTVLSSLGLFDASDPTRDATRVAAWPAGATSKDGLTAYEGGLKFNALLEWLQAQLDGTTPPTTKEADTKQKPAKAPEPVWTPSAEPIKDTKAQDAARRAKLDEAERRDRERRERAAAKAAQAQAEAQARAQEAEEAVDVDGEGDSANVEASPVEDAPAAVPEENAEDVGPEVVGGEAGLPVPAEPVPEQEVEVEEVEAENTERVHEEL